MSFWNFEASARSFSSGLGPGGGGFGWKGGGRVVPQPDAPAIPIASAQAANMRRRVATAESEAGEVAEWQAGFQYRFRPVPAAQSASCFGGRTTISATFTSIGCVTA
jgi:hypothetical protein